MIGMYSMSISCVDMYTKGFRHARQRSRVKTREIET
jgi:hypothetical protein